MTGTDRQEQLEEQSPETADAQAINGAAVDPIVGKVVAGRFKILELIGAGAMGTVYKAINSGTGSIVALKFVNNQHFGKERSRKRFLQEAKVLGALQHKNIIAVKSIEAEADQLFLVMEYFPGCSLSQYLKQRKLSVEELKDLFVQIAAALAHAHEAGIVHRDVKPANILVARDEECGVDVVKLVDFGIAKLLQVEHQQLTTSGIVGSFAYMSPEQFNSANVDGRSDMYSLGIVMFEAITGETPFQSDSPMELAIMHSRMVLPKIDGDEFRHLENVISRATVKEPEQRFANMNDLIEALNGKIPQASVSKASSPRTGSPRTRSVAILIALAVSLVGMLSIVFVETAKEQAAFVGRSAPKPLNAAIKPLEAYLFNDQPVALADVKCLENSLDSTADRLDNATCFFRRDAYKVLAVYYDKQRNWPMCDKYFDAARKSVRKFGFAYADISQKWACSQLRRGDKAAAIRTIKDELEWDNRQQLWSEYRDMQTVLGLIESNLPVPEPLLKGERDAHANDQFRQEREKAREDKLWHPIGANVVDAFKKNEH